jgi:predicted lipid-binding transport protein (Tim44 family)
MKTPTLILAAALALGIATFDAEGAKRFGGGSNLGKQRAVPMKEAPKAAPAAPADASKAAPAAPAATPATPAAQPGFMSRWGGMIAGLGIGALLGSMFSGNFGGGIGILLMLLLAGGIAFFVMRLLASRAKPPVKPVAFAGIGQDLAAPPPIDLAANSAAAVEAVAPNVPADFPADAFLRQAKMAFIRLQAANDTRDLDDIRDYTTPEMYAEIAMQIEERGAAPQKTEVVNVHPTLLEVVEEGGFQIASVRFAGLIRENDKSNPESFDEVWHVRKKIGDTSSHWLIAGIQQLPEPLAA